MTVRHATATLLTDRLISVAPAAVGRPLTAGIKLGGTDIFLVIGAIGPSSRPVLHGAALPRCRVPRHGDSDPTTATSGESLFVGALASLMFVQMCERTLGEVTTSMRSTETTTGACGRAGAHPAETAGHTSRRMNSMAST